jgi:RNA-directed DNA polymerase
VLMNVALHGTEQAAGVRYIPTGSNAGTARPGSPVVIRYADDVLVLCHSRDQAEQALLHCLIAVAPWSRLLVRGQTACASSSKAAATRSFGGASAASS